MRTQKELNHLAPQERLFQAITKLGLPECIKQEIEEQIIFWGKNKIISRIPWTHSQWLYWYESNL